MSKENRFNHLVFGQLISITFNHHYCIFGAGNSHMQISLVTLLNSRIND